MRRAALVFLFFATAARAQSRYYLANDDHTDYLWSLSDTQYRQAFQDMLDYYLMQAENTATLPADQRGKFVCDGSLWLWEYEHNRSAADFSRLISHVRAGDITVPLQSLVLLPGAMPTEAILRDMYYAGRLERRFNLNLKLVIMMENQTLPAGLASLWAGSGALYSWKGICDCATQIDAANRPREIYHFVGPDGRQVVMKWNSVNGGNQSIGGYAEARSPGGVLNLMQTNSTFLSHWPWPVAAAFGYGWDDQESMTQAFVMAAGSLGSAQTRVIVSNEVDFFDDFVANYGTQIPTFGGSFGNEWDNIPASLAAPTASMRREVERLRTAEALAAIVAPLDSTLLAGREAARDQAFVDMGLFYEHDFGAGGNFSAADRIAFERNMLAQVTSYVESLYTDALAALGTLVKSPTDGSMGFVVFNPLSWQRTDMVELPIAPPVTVLDGTTELASQAAPGGSAVRVIVPNVPPLGFKVLSVRAGVGANFPLSATVSGASMDSALYRVTVSGDGAITSLIDHMRGNRDFAGAGALGRKAAAGSGAVTTVANGPVFTTLSAHDASAPAHDARITLLAGVPRVEIEDHVTQNFSSTVGFTFDFALSGITIRHEEAGIIAKVAKVSQGGSYADDNARYDFLTLNHFVDLSESGSGVTLSSADAYLMKTGNSSVATLDATTPRIFGLLGGNIDNLGYSGQGGDADFLARWALSPHDAYDQAAAMRAALEHQNPLVAVQASGGSSAPLNAPFSLLSITPADVIAFAVKPAEEGADHGLIVRLWNLAESQKTFDLAMTGLADAHGTTHIETDSYGAPVTPGHLSEALPTQRMQTYRLAQSTLPPAPDGGTGPGPGGSGGSGGGSGGAGGNGATTDSGGCGCSVGAKAAAPTPLWLLAALVFLARRRR